MRQRQILASTPGPAPWYWDTYPEPTGSSGKKYIWMHHGNQGPLGYLVTLAQRQDPNTPRLALNTYCRPFLLPRPPIPQAADQAGGHKTGELLGIWCPEPGYIRLLCFDPDSLNAFSLTEVAGWFKQSNERVYSVTEPIAELEISSRLAAGVHSLEVPSEFCGASELLLISSHPARSKADPANAILVLRPRERQVEVLPQRWFTADQYNIGHQWITRIARDPVSQCIVGEGIKIGVFELTPDGTDIARWLE